MILGVVEIVIPYGDPFFLAASLALERAGAAAAYTTELNFKNANSSYHRQGIVNPLKYLPYRSLNSMRSLMNCSMFP